MSLETTTTQATPTAPAAPLDFGKLPNVANHVKALNGGSIQKTEFKAR